VGDLGARDCGGGEGVQSRRMSFGVLFTRIAKFSSQTPVTGSLRLRAVGAAFISYDFERACPKYICTVSLDAWFICVSRASCHDSIIINYLFPT